MLCYILLSHVTDPVESWRNAMQSCHIHAWLEHHEHLSQHQGIATSTSLYTSLGVSWYTTHAMPMKALLCKCSQLCASHPSHVKGRSQLHTLDTLISCFTRLPSCSCLAPHCLLDGHLMETFPLLAISRSCVSQDPNLNPKLPKPDAELPASVWIS